MEEWKDIKEYEGLYQISNWGKVKSLGNKSNHKKEIILKNHTHNSGYECVILQNGKIKKHKLIHRLVAEAFIENTDNKACVNHINGIKTDNEVKNLEYCSYSENIKHAFKTGLIKPTTKKVKQYDLQGNFIKEYESGKQASKETGAYYKGITKCCRKEIKQSSGYIWKYSD